MSEFRSWLLHSASKLSKHGQIGGRLLVGTGFLALALAGQASAQAPVSTGSLSDIQQRIPLPEPANVPPPTAADFERNDAKAATTGSVEQKIEALIPVPEAANVPPLTAKDVEPAEPATAATPAAEPAKPATAATPAPEPAQQPATAAAPTEPTLSAEEIKKLTGKDLVNAPLAATLAVADRGIADKLREMLAGKTERLIDRKEDRQAVEAFYRDRGFEPLWIKNGTRTARADSAAKYLSGIGADGLYPADYPVPAFSAADAQSLAEAELRFTNSILDYARHAQTGRVHFSRTSGDVHYDLDLPEPAETLAKMAAASDLSAPLAAFNPPHPQYKALKAKLAELRAANTVQDIVRIPAGPTLRPGMEDARVAMLRKRLEVPGDRNSHRYDEAVTEAVLAFQKGAGIGTDGMVGPTTLRTLNGSSRANRVDAVIATMERWRWMPRELGRNHSILNIPDFTLKVVRDGTPIWQTRVVVGKNETKTPMLSDTMKFITVNPTWNVPPSIIANEYLPALQQDPTVLDRMGLRLEQNRDGTVRIYQPPGDSNALGRLRFNFPNKFLVYQHDTPDKNLFSRDARAFSHGCMRVQDPVKYAEVLLSITMPGENYSQQRIRNMFGPGEININFPRPLQVHITYQTAFVDEAGKLVVRDDLYGHDRALMEQLDAGDRRVADVPMVRRQASYSREELRMPNGVYYGEYGGYRDGGRAYGRNPVEEFFRGIFR